ncbi:uncharacterized protein LOC115885085 [Sitophilus oryzae]|uniref:Uncharacterized protein LOC115885085 n=1 Tax=Sitophilus oryzae TaxID=7048 RepID=A0A6J2Y7C8_SITOR|nr:uncharacterized protein LOC115885085 [Sitophilus oryzae]
MFFGKVSSVLVLVLALIKTGCLALECWKCTSDYDASCSDHFNTTRIFKNRVHLNDYESYGTNQLNRREPHLFTCEGMHTSTIEQYKNVCLKKVYIIPNRPNKYIRECRMVLKSHKVGECPSDVLAAATDRSLVHCSSCEYDGCNSANRNTVFLMGLLPLLIFIFTH